MMQTISIYKKAFTFFGALVILLCFSVFYSNTVKADITTDSLSVEYSGATQMSIGDSIDQSTLTVTYMSKSGDSVVLSPDEYTLSSYVVADLGTNTIIVSYDGLQTSFTIEGMDDAKITFETNGADTSVENTTCHIGYAIGQLPEVTKKGNTFEGWYSDKALTTKVTSETIIEDDTTLYAKWKKFKYTLVLNKNAEGSSDTIKMDCEYDVSRKLPKNAFARDGYEFQGWSYSAQGDVSFKEGEEFVNLSSTDGDTVDLYAIWKYANTYTEITNTIEITDEGDPGTAAVNSGSASAQTVVVTNDAPVASSVTTTEDAVVYSRVAAMTADKMPIVPLIAYISLCIIMIAAGAYVLRKPNL